METFKASNGVELGFGAHGHIMLGEIDTGLGEQAQDALREFFLHERDQELGRWRERPGCEAVVYPNGSDELGNRCVRVLFEPTAGELLVYENKIPRNLYGDAARNYFAAHPEPKPGHDAKPGEVWVLSCPRLHADPGPYTFRNGMFRCGESGALQISDSNIVAARRIWPEAVSDG